MFATFATKVALVRCLELTFGTNWNKLSHMGVRRLAALMEWGLWWGLICQLAWWKDIRVRLWEATAWVDKHQTLQQKAHSIYTKPVDFFFFFVLIVCSLPLLGHSDILQTGNHHDHVLSLIRHLFEEQPIFEFQRAAVIFLGCLYRVPTTPGNPGKPGILSFTFPGLAKCLQFAQKVGNSWNNSKPERTWNI